MEIINGWKGLIENNVTQNVSFEGCQISEPTIEEIMIFLERGEVNEKLMSIGGLAMAFDTLIKDSQLDDGLKSELSSM